MIQVVNGAGSKELIFERVSSDTEGFAQNSDISSSSNVEFEPMNLDERQGSCISIKFSIPYNASSKDLDSLKSLVTKNKRELRPLFSMQPKRYMRKDTLAQQNTE